MATYNKFNQFVVDVAHKAHDLSADQLRVALSATAPTATMKVLIDLTGEIDYTNLGAPTARDLVTTSSGDQDVLGQYDLILEDLVLSATGPVATFQYVVVYNSTAVGGPLIGWYDNLTGVTLANAETFTINFTDLQRLLSIT